MADQNLSSDEVAALKALLRADVGPVEPEAIRQGLLAQGLVRPSGEGFCVTLKGHSAYLTAMSEAFGSD